MLALKPLALTLLGVLGGDDLHLDVAPVGLQSFEGTKEVLAPGAKLGDVPHAPRIDAPLLRAPRVVDGPDAGEGSVDGSVRIFGRPLRPPLFAPVEDHILLVVAHRGVPAVAELHRRGVVLLVLVGVRGVGRAIDAAVGVGASGQAEGHGEERAGPTKGGSWSRLWVGHHGG